jgi:hypothetical protein
MPVSVPTPVLPALELPSLARKGVTVDFDGGDLSSDAGFLPLKLADQQLGLTAALAAAIEDLRDPAKVQHDVLALLCARIYLIAAGYEDAVDAQTMRHDPLLKAALGRTPADPALAGQSTLSRFENSITKADLARLGQVLLEVFLDRCGPNPREIVLDFDPFVDPAHGAQQGVLFNGYYDTYCYLPLYLCGRIDGGREYVVGALLRGGTAPATKGARFLLKYLVRALRARFPDVRLIVRGDSAFGVAKMLRTCHHLQLKYCFGLAQNTALERRSTDIQARAAAAAALRQQQRPRPASPRRAFGAFRYAARSWRKTERVVAKGEVTQGVRNTRYVVTNLTAADGWTPRRVYLFYCGRGNPENRIKEFKVDLRADRLSCEFRAANQFRLLLHVAAYHLYQQVQDALTAVTEAGSEWRRAQVATIREKLCKVAARVRTRCRTVRVSLPSSYPWASVWRALVLHLAQAPARSGPKLLQNA